MRAARITDHIQAHHGEGRPARTECLCEGTTDVGEKIPRRVTAKVAKVKVGWSRDGNSVLGVTTTTKCGIECHRAAKVGNLSIRIGLGWAKSHAFTTGQCPVKKYNRNLMMAILHDRVQIAKACNVTVVPLDQAPEAYLDFDRGAAKKYVLDPHDMLGVA